MQNPLSPYQQIYLDLTFLSSSNLASQATHSSLSAEVHSGLPTERPTGGFVALSPALHCAGTGDQRKCKPDHMAALPRHLPFFLISCPIKHGTILPAKQSLHSRSPSPDTCRLSHLFPSLFHSTHGTASLLLLQHWALPDSGPLLLGPVLSVHLNEVTSCTHLATPPYPTGLSAVSAFSTACPDDLILYSFIKFFMPFSLFNVIYFHLPAYFLELLTRTQVQKKKKK